MKKAKNTKIEILPNGKLRLSKLSDGGALETLVGKKPENLSQTEIGLLVKAICDELGWLDKQGKIT